MAQDRPGSVTIVSALTWLAAAMDLIAGAALIWLYYHPEDLSDEIEAGNLLWYGLTTLAIAVFTAAVAAGLAMGSQGARVLVILVMIVRIAAAAYGLGSIGGTFALQAAIEIPLALVVIALLSTRRASAWFRGAPAT
ncbi:hypothetical protein [Demequina gelatinilytica]|uniref:hypothetical protein n=1 Tax=Demequina gelatinilytica TaxID=1638980 RepID=UPI000781343B|nr:hypothetical protein [Demequina gelatinilytica]